MGKRDDEKKILPVEVTVEKPTSRKKGGRGSGMKAYHDDVGKMTDDMVSYATGMSKDLLKVKIALMGAVRKVESKMRERREG